MSRPLDIVVVGLSLSSSWGNGHATTFRALLAGARELGHRILFLERDKPWYAAHRDLPEPGFCDLRLYDTVDELIDTYGAAIASADAVIVGSYVPDGIEVIDRLAAIAPDTLHFYDIDTPVTLAALSRGEESFLAVRQIPLFQTYFSFTGGPTLDRLETEFGARRARPLYCSVEPERYAPTGTPPGWDLGYLGTYSPDRQPTLEALLIEPARRLPQMRFVVAGPQYPADIDWPANVERIDHLEPAFHPDFYSRQRFTLNVTRADMIAAGWSPSVRLFEAGACGTAIISDHWDGLTTLLPDGEAILIARSTEDVVNWLTTVTPDAREAMAGEARRRVLSEHTGLARARELTAALTDTAEQPRLERTAAHA
ncbi:CgeB family protein [Mangrovicella endophytica]|uniref:CgeB family protein n=1 Tax=Mangrovicella endophytica TaxID=2066697 RepID=UPI000C9E8804|nr:glycosyltransferase [Mangrovicella endophytica]